MLTRRDILRTSFTVGVGAVVAPAAGCARRAASRPAAHPETNNSGTSNEDAESMPGAEPLTLRHFPAGESGFFRAPVLIEGATEAVLIDGGFSYADGEAVRDAIQASGKNLTTIYISQSDPDYYFSLQPIRTAFPRAKVIASPEVVAAIEANVEKKLAVWGPKLGKNGPQTLADIVMPAAVDVTALTVDGESIEIVPAEGLANRRHLYVPSLNAVVGGVMIFAGAHVWTADTPTKEQRAHWIANLRKIAERAPTTVVPGHMTLDAATDLTGVRHTIDYLVAFEEELAKSGDAAALESAMKARFPGLPMGIALEIGSKVVTGEMKWG